MSGSEPTSGGSSTSRSPRPYARGRDRREELLRAAARVFAREGYGGARVATLAAEAGMTDAGLLHHFPSKAALYLAVLESRSNLADVLDAYDLGRTLADSVEDLIDYVAKSMNNPDLMRFRAVVSGELLLDGNPAYAQVSARHHQNLPVMAERVRRAQAAGEVDSGIDPQQAVLELYALNEGMRHLAMSYPGDFDLVSTFAVAARRWLASLRPAPTSDDR